MPTIASIKPVKDALALFKDVSPIMVALAQTLRQTGAPPPPHRDLILAFDGFRQGTHPKISWLVSLSKNDLDILAWVFVVSKHGRKDEVATRIVYSLFAPLKHRTPPLTKKPGIPLRIDARYASRTPANNNTTTTNNNNNTTTPNNTNSPLPYHHSNTNSNLNPASPIHPALAPSTSAQTNPRGNMPSLSPHSHLPGTHLINSLNSQLARPSSNSSRQQTLSSHPRPTTGGKTPRKLSYYYELCRGWNFDNGESPFNRPLDGPLGISDPPFVIFTSMHLTRGNNDPTLRFHTPPPLTAEQRPEVAGGDVKVHLRCFRIEADKPRVEWKQAWPFPAACKVNNNPVALNQAQRYTNGKLAGKDGPTDITPYLRRYRAGSTQEPNRICLRRQMGGSSVSSGHYVLFAQQILVINHKTMVESVRDASAKYWIEYRQNQEKLGRISKTATTFEMAKQGVMSFLSDPDSITVSSMRVQLRCPLGLTRIKTPVKGKRCHHVQCFDLDNFLEYSRRSGKFSCPVCDKDTAYPNMLIISPYIEHALQKFENCDEVEIFQNGSMVEAEKKQAGGIIADDKDNDSNRVKQEPRGSSAGKSSANTSAPAPAPDVVDLTLDSDDDDEPPVVQMRRRGGSSRSIAHSTRSNAMRPRFSDNVVTEHLDEDPGFSFHADNLWGEAPANGNHHDGGGTPISRSGQNFASDNWSTMDVIALDSD